jgi:hypothetical protein
MTTTPLNETNGWSLACCALCSEWSAGKTTKNKKTGQVHTEAFCTTHQINLPYVHLRRIGCAKFIPEMQETYAVHLRMQIETYLLTGKILPMVQGVLVHEGIAQHPSLICCAECPGVEDPGCDFCFMEGDDARP